jgi:hypothetical protein
VNSDREQLIARAKDLGVNEDFMRDLSDRARERFDAQESYKILSRVVDIMEQMAPRLGKARGAQAVAIGLNSYVKLVDFLVTELALVVRSNLEHLARIDEIFDMVEGALLRGEPIPIASRFGRAEP